MSDAIVVRDLAVRYENFMALEGATLSARFGEALGIIGPNGSGKSTLLKTIAGLLKPSSGSVCVLDKEPRELPPGTIAYVPQIEAVDWSFPATVWDVVAMGRFPRLGLFRRFGAEDRKAVRHALEQLRMEELIAAAHLGALRRSATARICRARDRARTARAAARRADHRRRRANRRVAARGRARTRRGRTAGADVDARSRTGARIGSTASS